MILMEYHIQKIEVSRHQDDVRIFSFLFLQREGIRNYETIRLIQI